MTIIEPIDKAKQSEAIARVQYYIDLASSLYQEKIPAIDVVFNLRGKAAGMYRCFRPHKSTKLDVFKTLNNSISPASSRRQIRFNPWLFAKYPEDSYDNTIPHEVAHYISDCLYSLNNIKPHGSEWKMIMRDFGAVPNVRGKYTLEGIPVRNIRRYKYQCSCRQVGLTSHRHRKVRQGIQQYRCRDCRQVLVLVADVFSESENID
jgi:SprT protein